MESSLRGAQRRSNPENLGALCSPGLLRFARNDAAASTQMQLDLEGSLMSLRRAGLRDPEGARDLIRECLGHPRVHRSKWEIASSGVLCAFSPAPPSRTRP